ncbi:hypothetical protein SAMN05421766_11069 [Zobellia uliginosa]|uniref:Uncharacterized protein n=1 Tax=Zobellia uliginosa TaxID=143224 RepID=A0ABY1L1K6_9FLAO|nr:hypothetical protein SAMN05421766_11069 [Zobellia uliginosa]
MIHLLKVVLQHFLFINCETQSKQTKQLDYAD